MLLTKHFFITDRRVTAAIENRPAFIHSMEGLFFYMRGAIVHPRPGWRYPRAVTLLRARQETTGELGQRIPAGVIRRKLPFGS